MLCLLKGYIIDHLYASHLKTFHGISPLLYYILILFYLIKTSVTFRDDIHLLSVLYQRRGKRFTFQQRNIPILRAL